MGYKFNAMRLSLFTLSLLLLCTSCTLKREKVDQITNGSNETIKVISLAFNNAAAIAPLELKPGETAVLRLFEGRDKARGVACPHDPLFLTDRYLVINDDTLSLSGLADSVGWKYEAESYGAFSKEKDVCTVAYK